MKVIEGFWGAPRVENPTVLTFGKFDALHRGHQAIFRQTIERARASGRDAAVFFLHPHPMKLLDPERCPPMLTPLPKKLELLERFGFDLAIIGRFDSRLRQMEPVDFLERLATALRAEVIVVGYSVRFGYEGRGDSRTLKECAAPFGYEVAIVELQQAEGNVISSTRIRQAIRDGDLALAERLLGRPYSVLGRVIEGSRRGRILGYPTANLDHGDQLLPPKGIYAAVTIADGKRYGSAVSLGVRPTFGGGDVLLESHLLDFAGNLYGKEIEVVFVEKIRDEERFEDVEALRRQMDADVRRIRARLREG